jgi:hypothetical protein
LNCCPAHELEIAWEVHTDAEERLETKHNTSNSRNKADNGSSKNHIHFFILMKRETNPLNKAQGFPI